MLFALALIACTAAVRMNSCSGSECCTGSKCSTPESISKFLQVRNDTNGTNDTCDPVERDIAKALWFVSNHDQDRVVTTEEFNATLTWAEENHEELAQHIENGFNDVDLDQDGIVTRKEMRNMTKNLTSRYEKRMAWALFRAFDLNKDGEVDWEHEVVPLMEYFAENWEWLKEDLWDGFYEAAGEDGELTLRELMEHLGCKRKGRRGGRGRKD